MRRWIVYAVGMILLALLPGAGEEIGNLRPVGLVYLYADANELTIATDTGDWGSGTTIEEAMKDLEKSAPGKIFLETAEYLVVDENAISNLAELAKNMRPGVKVCFTKEHLEADKAWEHLSAHEPNLTIQKLGEEKPEWIVIKEGKYQLE